MQTERVSAFIRQNWLLLGVFSMAVLAALWFAFHTISDALYFNDPRNVDVDLKPWMTPRYIVLTYDLPRPLVLELLRLDPEEDQRVRLGRLAQQRGITMEDLTKQIRDAAGLYREEQK